MTLGHALEDPAEEIVDPLARPPPRSTVTQEQASLLKPFIRL